MDYISLGKVPGSFPESSLSIRPTLWDIQLGCDSSSVN